MSATTDELATNSLKTVVRLQDYLHQADEEARALDAVSPKVPSFNLPTISVPGFDLGVSKQMASLVKAADFGLGLQTAVFGESLGKSFAQQIGLNLGSTLSQSVIGGFKHTQIAGAFGAFDQIQQAPIFGQLEALVKSPVISGLQGHYDEIFKSLVAPLAKAVVPDFGLALKGWTPLLATGSVFGAFVGTPWRIRRSVEAWLDEIRLDLQRKRDGMWFALEHSPDPVGQAAHSAVELLLHLFDCSGVSDGRVVTWASGSVHDKEALDRSGAYPRVVWAGRARMAAIKAGFDEVGQELVIDLARSGRELQQIKHRSHRFEVGEVQPHLERVEELLSLFAWRL